MHHTGDWLWVAWTNRGDAPERIFLGRIDLRGDWSGWEIEETLELLRPEKAWEGADQPVSPSQPGIVVPPSHQLRDPCFFEDDGQMYLFYAVAGESGIAVARLFGMEDG